MGKNDDKLSPTKSAEEIRRLQVENRELQEHSTWMMQQAKATSNENEVLRRQMEDLQKEREEMQKQLAEQTKFRQNSEISRTFRIDKILEINRIRRKQIATIKDTRCVRIVTHTDSRVIGQREGEKESNQRRRDNVNTSVQNGQAPGTADSASRVNNLWSEEASEDAEQPDEVEANAFTLCSRAYSDCFEDIGWDVDRRIPEAQANDSRQVFNTVMESSKRDWMLDALKDLKEAQKDDEYIQRILSKPETSFQHQTADEITYIKSLTGNEWKIILPKSLVVSVVSAAHQKFGHAGNFKLLQYLPKQFLSLVQIEIARENLKKSYEGRCKTQKSISKVKLFEGDLVLLWVPHVSKADEKQISKFFELYEGPYRIARCIGENAFEIVEDSKNAIAKGVYDRMSLRPYHAPSKGDTPATA
ncbi:hypothetical protein QAD02_012736 [Eretmocerus hayati]|uniref:Uncharacterized protein n=1 Tax=Eretmocerus hayati TaxID=131215 RepID=A0ACC2P0U7_9HYME|nr:hypothetical protein QAD02_012736 [Eretmocerus hayati]